MPARTAVAVLLALPLLGACAYDLDALERAATPPEGGVGLADGGGSFPKELIDLFEGLEGVDRGCQQCAATHCAEANTACHDDPECEQVTACLARSQDPRNHAECRERHLDWFREHIDTIDVGGPFFDCVFWRECRSQCGADEDLACQGDYRFPQGQSGGELSLTLLLEEALLSTPGAGARAKVCRIEDLDCEDPSMTATADDEGLVDLLLPAALGQFTGYIEITGADLAPTLLVFGWPMANDDAVRMPIVSETTLELQQRVGGRAPTSDTGMVQTRVRGCSRVGLRNVQVEVSPAGDDTRTWYFDDQAPTFEARGTFSNGNAGVVNVPAGLVDVVGTRVGNGDEVLRWKVPVRADHLTILVTAPNDR